MSIGIPGVYVVPGASKSFVVDGDQGVTLIDTGLPGREGEIARVLTAIGRRWRDVRAIAITHSHADHVGSAAAAKRASRAPLLASAADAPAVRGEEPSPPPPLFRRLPFLEPLSRLTPRADAVEVEYIVSEGHSPGLPDDLSVIDTPGHTPGHVSYLLARSGGVLFVGDAAVATRGGAVKRGWMNGATPRIDASLRHLAEFTFDAALFAHSRPLLHGAGDAFGRLASSLS